MKVIGLTGPSGAGKGVAASILLQCGIPVIDADRVYHDILTRGDDCTKELTEAFGEQILGEDGLVCRAALAEAVFGKPDTEDLLHTLNTITHKYVMSETQKMLQAYQKSGARAVAIDAPQLFEANAHLECDFVIGVIAARDLREARIMARDHISQARAEKRLEAQKSDDFFRARCDYILENNTDEATLGEQLKQVLLETGVGLV